MPLYEYQCDKCGDVFEVMQKFVDEPLTVHEKCGGAVHRLISAPALQFKGSGWYVNDYAKGGNSAPPNGGSKKHESGEGSSSKDSSSKESASSESSSKSSDTGSSKSSDSASSSSTPASTTTSSSDKK
jgi:putative FmdB family regulatory protein